MSQTEPLPAPPTGSPFASPAAGFNGHVDPIAMAHAAATGCEPYPSPCATAVSGAGPYGNTATGSTGGCLTESERGSSGGRGTQPQRKPPARPERLLVAAAAIAASSGESECCLDADPGFRTPPNTAASPATAAVAPSTDERTGTSPVRTAHQEPLGPHDQQAILSLLASPKIEPPPASVPRHSRSQTANAVSPAGIPVVLSPGAFTQPEAHCALSPGLLSASAGAIREERRRGARHARYHSWIKSMERLPPGTRRTESMGAASAEWDEEDICALCCDLPCECVRAECCRGVLCLECAAELTQCPYCRTLPFRWAPDETARRKLGAVETPCRNRELGCDCVVPQLQLRWHLDHDCPFSLRRCRHCRMVLCAPRVWAHEDSCTQQQQRDGAPEAGGPAVVG
eukprot:TRINITY_DN50504_c0_g1_i1.p2 TRINITY_DN50504_c0_g1~~TRINITY_DN50504_c0_g1_i1.p2  ORF type:complete len:400 (+),score=78.91 TRINITY_DN50504_c0_g1_i1:90-1289(+)